MKQKTFFLLAAAVVVSLLLAACGGAETPEPTTMPTNAPTEEPTADSSDAAAEATMADLTALAEHPWQWESFTNPAEEFEVETPESYLLTFNSDGSLSVKADCNSANGSYTADATSLTIEMGPMTMAACPEESRSDQFVQLLGGAALYFFEGDNLYVDLMADGGTMVFAPAGDEVVADDGEGALAGALRANPWQWVSFTSPVEQFEIETPENYVVSFNQDSTVAITADCNNAGGSYEITASLTIEIGPMTTAACSEGSRGEQFVQLLGGAVDYFIEDGNLYIELMADGGTMTFSPASVTEAAIPEETQVFGDNISWQLSVITDPVNGETVIKEPELITLALIDDGSAVIVAGCRIAVGTYETDGSALTLAYEIPEKYDESCEDGPNEVRFLELSQGATTYYTQDGRLFIELMADGGTLVFDPHQLPEIVRPTTAVDLCGEDALTINEIEATLAPEQAAALDETLPELVGETTPSGFPSPGASLLVITPEGRYFKSVGVADVTSCEPLAADALFEIGSNTKLMTAAMIYQLQEEGVLATSDLISQWAPEMAALVPNGDQITIDMLLTHTNGIYDYLNGTAENGPLAKGIEDKGVLTQSFTPEELVQLAVESGEPYFEPGADGQWMYSNTGYILLGLIIEAATGKSYEQNLQERIFEPLGLENTFLLNGQPESGLLPQGYWQPPFDYTTGEWNATQAWSAGAVVSNAEDFAAFLKALFTGQLFVDPATVDLMLEPASPGYPSFNERRYYGHGMFYKYGLLGHGGQALGYQSDVGYLPGEDVTIVIWGNSAENAIGQYAPEVAQLLGLIAKE